MAVGIMKEAGGIKFFIADDGDFKMFQHILNQVNKRAEIENYL